MRSEGCYDASGTICTHKQGMHAQCEQIVLNSDRRLVLAVISLRSRSLYSLEYHTRRASIDPFSYGELVSMHAPRQLTPPAEFTN